jgi:hypothetical protein
MSRPPSSSILPALAFWLVTTFVPSSARAEPRPARSPARLVEVAIDVEFYAPTHGHRSIETGFFNVLVGVEVVRVLHLLVAGGLTSTSAWGTIIRPDAHHQDTTYPTAAVGIGPAFLLRCSPLQVGRFALGADVFGAVVIYDVRLPPGGDVYNYTWRLGGAISIHVDASLDIVAGVRWMHVSNGQGLGPQNPSYEGAGALLELVGRY